jgi:signal transduction histidine kinase/ActR/RegA family two-component response regulator
MTTLTDETAGRYTVQPGRIRNRLIVMFVVLLVGAMVVATTALLFLRVSDIKQRIIEESIVKANTIAVQVAPSLEFDESSQAQSILSNFSSDTSVRAISITDSAGEIFGSYGESTPPSKLFADSSHVIGSKWLWVLVPVSVDSSKAGNVLLQVSLQELNSEVQRSLMTNLPVILGVVCLTVLLMLKAVKVITRPVSSLSRTAAEIAEKGDYSLRARKFANDEIGILTDGFNRMLETIEAQSKKLEEQHGRLSRSERLESLGLLAGGVAHDLNNILGPMVALPEFILKKLDRDHGAREDIEMISKASRRAGVVIQDLLSLARRGTYKLEAVDLNEMIRDCLASPAVGQRLAEAPGVTCSVEFDEGLWAAKGSEPHLTQVVMNLAINAIEAMGQSVSNGTLTVRTERVKLEYTLDAYETIPAGEYTMISVKDQGPGISSEGLKRIFEPFYTSKKMGSSGSGLGLAVVYGVVHDHGGFLDVISVPGRGAEFRIYLQRHTAAAINDREKISSGRDEKSARILVVDDYDPQRILTEKLLESLGHITKSASGGRQAVALLREDSEFDLMVVDMIMEDGFDGLDTIREALEINPDLRCIIATGYSETDRVASALELGASACLNKPYTVKTLCNAVNRALEDQLTLAS